MIRYRITITRFLTCEITRLRVSTLIRSLDDTRCQVERTSTGSSGYRDDANPIS